MSESDRIVVLLNSPGHRSLRYVFTGTSLGIVVGPEEAKGDLGADKALSRSSYGVMAQINASTVTADMVPSPRLTGDISIPAWAQNDSVYTFLREAWHQHLSICDLCNYATDCFMCDVADPDEYPAPHNCACPANGGGWGFRLSRLYDEYFKKMKANSEIRSEFRREFQSTVKSTLEHLDDADA